MEIQLRIQKPRPQQCSKPPLSVFGKQAPGSGLAGELPFLVGRAEGVRAAEPGSARILPAAQVRVAAFSWSRSSAAACSVPAAFSV